MPSRSLMEALYTLISPPEFPPTNPEEAILVHLVRLKSHPTVQTSYLHTTTAASTITYYNPTSTRIPDPKPET